MLQEKYLDSIQGRIDLFTNSVQTMWQNTLDDDVIKFFVNIGTQLIKLIDNLGLIKTLIISIGTYAIKKYANGNLFGGLMDMFNTPTIDKMKNNLKKLKKARDDAAEALGKSPNSKSKSKIKI